MALINNKPEQVKPNLPPVKSQVEPANAAELLELYDAKPKSKMNFKIIIAVVALMVVGLLLMQLGGKKGETSGQAISDVITQQVSILELVEVTQQDLKAAKTQNTVLSMASVITTDKTLLVGAATKAKIVMPKTPDSVELPATTTKKIRSAETSATYDSKIVELIKEYLDVYQTKLKTAYDITKSAAVKAVIDSAFSNCDNFKSEL